MLRSISEFALCNNQSQKLLNAYSKFETPPKKIPNSLKAVVTPSGVAGNVQVFREIQCPIARQDGSTKLLETEACESS